MNTLRCDYLIVGGGTAGCVLAARLSEDPNIQVALVEVGGTPWDLRFTVPAGVPAILGRSATDWCYQAEHDPTINGRTLDWSAGKVLGGGSSVNGMVYIRGAADDYNRWDLLNGDKSGWSWADVEPLFRRIERFVDRQEPHLGSDGPVAVSATKVRNTAADRFIQAGRELGFDPADFNSGQLLGFGEAEGNIDRGRRAGAYQAYLSPVRHRQNLHVLTRTACQELLLDGRRVVGARVVQKGETIDVYAAAEVVVSCGAIGSPALLLRSGIGDAQQLADRGIPVRHTLVGVGRNLQEHVGCGLSKFVNVPSINSARSPRAGIGHLLQYLFQRQGLLASPVVQSMAYVKTQPNLERPDVQLALVPFAYRMRPDSRSALTAEMPTRDGVMISGFIANPKTRGRVMLDENAQPRVEFRYFDEPDDLEVLVRSCRFIQRLCQQPALAEIIEAECSLQQPTQSDDDWVDYIRANAIPCYHFSGTCRMGVDDEAVVDPRLRVRGLDGLRVVDASIMPTVTSGNTNAPVMMIAEKAAQMMKEAVQDA